MTGYYAQIRFGYTNAPLHKQFHPFCQQQRPTATIQQPPTVSGDLLLKKNRDQPLPPTNCPRRPSPNEVLIIDDISPNKPVQLC